MAAHVRDGARRHNGSQIKGFIAASGRLIGGSS